MRNIVKYNDIVKYYSAFHHRHCDRVVFCGWLVGKSWDEIIPAAERHRIDEEELHQQLVALNPPPRSRKTVSKSVSNRIVDLTRLSASL